MSSSNKVFFGELFDAASGSYKSYINGQWLRSCSNKVVTITNPATRKEEFKVQACTREEIDAAYEGCTEAQKIWRQVPLWKRAEALRKVASVLREQRDTIAECLVNEIAKARKDSLSEVDRSADLIEYCAEEGIRLLSKGDFLTSDAFKGTDRTKLCLSSRVPLGNVLCIPPFNYPVNLAVSKIAPALISGNAVLVKPPTQGAVSGLHLAQCFDKAGVFPKGLVNFVTVRASENGDYLAEHPSNNCLSFTGGDVGLSLAKKVGMIPIQMELGGKDACIVCSDADLDLAAKHIIKGGFSYSGQRCTAVKVVLVEGEVADQLIEKVLGGVNKLTVGMPDDNCNITPVISETSANFIEKLVMDAKEKGAKFLTEYRREGNLIWPCLLDHVRPDMDIAWEEPFGPVLPIMRVSNTDQAVEHANKNRVALQSCVFTKDIEKAIKISDSVQSGTVQINGAPARGPDHFPFQGFRDSGIGSQGIANSIGMMTKTKTTVINLNSPSFTV
ncbi:NADP-dependent glyceraldehyde-3-phosphate dehydrogenase [Chloropicon primus]|uniref:NADP-dependent glyceraldehyde-3-phosphate dehydrogenase n=1 Tax=Chloropicon primus TaxID=1764295 RepID=A0A5B8MJ24_9CHLO|nr:NADP-dependent glyceraldehyde-3-phosphate dehydrogenase [Chloropicon primus]UPQ99672.1 NADP-dependent glyceraldehyde-3-phosphate dehydrogenase [Chloropicon primus]|eukprot:QDZ20463.1 NADP-dependent glyceraldehyde-3-phosphate dehydrogenase [Chloropicon primus]